MAHGGERKGAGRKPKEAEERTKELCRAVITEKYGSLQEGLKMLLESKSDRLRLFVYEHAYGKAVENLNVGGALSIQLTRKVVR